MKHAFAGTLLLSGLTLGLALALVAPAAAEDRLPGDECVNCPPPRKYDSEEVVKTSKDIDRSQVINTTTVVPAGKRVKEINSLVIHQNETRNIGTIQHNHTIVEKETRYVRRIPVETVVQFVVQKYRIEETPANYVTVPVAPRRLIDCHRGRYSRAGSCGPVLRVRG